MLIRTVSAALALALPLAAAVARAETPHHSGRLHHHHSPYAGQEKRTIKSLSAGDVAALRRGAGWGLAKAAELNGVPGPAHLLQLKDRIPLSADQVTRIEALYAEMQRRAVAAGARLIGLERALNDGFANGTMTDERLRSLLDRIAAARKTLRYIHLSFHLRTPALLTAAQIARYNALRGYTRPAR